MLSHISLGTNDFERAKAFYDAVMAALGYRCLIDRESEAAYGRDFPQFWICRPLDESRPASVGHGSHIAFWADGRAAVEAFHAAALEAGGQDAGAPGPRPQYGASYYGAFIIDPDGHKIEAEFWDREAADKER